MGLINCKNDVCLPESNVIIDPITQTRDKIKDKTDIVDKTKTVSLIFILIII